MAKGKNVNPADAFRKAQRKKELKKNKTERSKARDFALVKKDTSDLQDEIEGLEALEKPTAEQANRLKSAKAELESVNKKKEEYVKEHPEQRRLVFRARRDKNEGGDKPPEEIVLPKKRNLFRKDGLPRHPERSIYYDPVMNPFGVAPPGMPYMERPLLPGEVDSEAEDSGEDDDDDDIAMPEGPPPGVLGDEEAVAEDEDIPMPEGLPPGEDPIEDDEDIPLPPSEELEGLPPLPPHPPPGGMAFVPPPLPGFPMGLPPPPPGFPGSAFPPPPLGFQAGVPPPPPPPHGVFPVPPPFPPNFPPGFNQPVTGYPAMPPPPPGFFPRQRSTSAMQDPLSSIPHQTFQAHRASKLAPSHPSLPAKPSDGSVSAVASSSATVFAEPELRDFKKEATAFVPNSLKRKRVGGASRVNAAPGIEESEDTDADTISAAPERPDLLSTIQNQFGIPSTPLTEVAGKKAKVEDTKPAKKDDYHKFMEEMGDLIGPS